VWETEKRRFAASWRELFTPEATLKVAPSPDGARTETMISRKSVPSLVARAQTNGPLVQRVMRSMFADESDAWCLREVWSVDLAVMVLDKVAQDSSDPWGNASERGAWRTLALIEHENVKGRRGLMMSVRKLLDYRSDALRVAIGYSSNPDDDLRPSEWGPLLHSADSAAGLSSILLVVGAITKGSEEWRILDVAEFGWRPIGRCGQ